MSVKRYDWTEDGMEPVGDGNYVPFDDVEVLLEELNLLRGERQRYVSREHWIPVSDRRPERNETVLYWHKPVVGGECGWVAQADEWRDEQHGAVATHWMPMPSSPNKEGS